MLAKVFDNMRVLMLEGFVPSREQVHPAIRFHGDSPVSIEFNFEDPVRAVWQVKDAGAVHWLDEVGFSFLERIQPLARNLPHDR